MPVLASPRHEAFAHALARGSTASAAYIEAGYKQNRHNAAALAREQHISTRVGELQEEQLAIHQQATAEAAANAQVSIESLISEAEAARAMGCSVGTVKAACSRGLRRLRELSDSAAGGDDAPVRPPGSAPAERDVTPPQPAGSMA